MLDVLNATSADMARAGAAGAAMERGERCRWDWPHRLLVVDERIGRRGDPLGLIMVRHEEPRFVLRLLRL